MSDNFLIVFGLIFGAIGTTLGSAFVFLLKKDVPAKLNAIFLGFSSGVMIAASVWSLLIPAYELSLTLPRYEKVAWLPSLLGFLLGSAFLFFLDKLIPHFHGISKEEEGLESKRISRGWKLFLAMTIHNIPEGLAVGFAFGAAAALGNEGGANVVSLFGAFALSLGIFIQNVPEGAAVAMPLYTESGSRKKAFFLGTLSGLVEPLFGVIGFFLAHQIATLLPWFLAFAAGAMVYVVVDELIPEASQGDHKHFGTFGVIFGFALMMVLDIALG